jgi:hypothetical protein
MRGCITNFPRQAGRWIGVWLVAFVLLHVAAAPVAANVEYTYVGSELTPVPCANAPCSSPYTAGDMITGDVVTSAPVLSPNFAFQSFQSYSFSDGVGTLTNTNSYIGEGGLVTDTSGNVTSATYLELISNDQRHIIFVRANPGDFASYASLTPTGSCCVFSGANSASPGTWSGPTIVNPPPPPPSCSSILNGSVNVSVNSNVVLVATFTPQGGASGLTDAEAACGFSSFNWQQKVTHDPMPLTSALTGQPLTVPYSDPPQGGYLTSKGQIIFSDQYPYYYNGAELTGACPLPDGTTIPIQTTATLAFCDAPKTPGLLPSEFVGFETYLVGICSQIGESGCTSVGQAELLYQIIWTDNYNGELGGIAFNGEPLRSNLDGSNPTGGTGGITILSEGSVLAPEPSSILLFTLGLVVLSAMRRHVVNI